MTVLSLKDISFAYRSNSELRIILDGINEDFELGKLYVILGNSGSGKTSLLSLMGALDTQTKGQILYKGTSLESMGYERYRRNHAGMVFQSYNLIPWMNSIENLQVAMSITDNSIPKDAEVVAVNLLEYLGIDKDKAKRRVTALSGGEQQRVSIARALATNGDIILADEPTGNLDEQTSNEIVRILKTLAHEHNKCVVMVTHSSIIAKEADVVLKLSDGHLTRTINEPAPAATTTVAAATAVAPAAAATAVAPAVAATAVAPAVPAEPAVEESRPSLEVSQ